MPWFVESFIWLSISSFLYFLCRQLYMVGRFVPVIVSTGVSMALQSWTYLPAYGAAILVGFSFLVAVPSAVLFTLSIHGKRHKPELDYFLWLTTLLAIDSLVPLTFTWPFWKEVNDAPLSLLNMLLASPGFVAFIVWIVQIRASRRPKRRDIPTES